jgi:LmbE family N-acetylglucosaminyl deacetylase
MLELTLDGPKTVLCLGAHCDDIEIGCGGTLLRWIERNPDLTVWWVVVSSTPVRAEEATRCAERFLGGVKEKQIIVKPFRASFFPYEGEAIKEFFEELKGSVKPDVILTHYRHDLHQDHRVMCDLTWNTFRNHFILEYEIPKYDGDLGVPNMFVPLEERHYSQKIDHLLECFPSQSDKHWFSRETFMALMRLRGMESASPSAYAEAFYCRKACLAGPATTR